MNGTICFDNKKCTISMEERETGEAKRDLGNFKPLNLIFVTCNSCGLSRKTFGLQNKKKIFPVQESKEAGKNTQP